MRTDVMGDVYLLHFSEPYKHASHYMGWSEKLETRLASHERGDGARLMRVIKDAGLTFTVSRTWRGTRALERQLKKRGGHARLCPVCKEAQA